MKNSLIYKYLVCLAFISIWNPNLAFSERYGPYEIDEKGVLGTLKLTQAEKGSQGATFFFVTDNPVTSVVEVYLDGPEGLSLTGKIGSLVGKTPEAAVAQSGKLYQVPLIDSKAKAKQKIITALQPGESSSSGSSSGSTSGSTNSGGLTYDQCMASSVVQELVDRYGVDKDAFCRAQSSPGGGENPTGPGGEFSQTSGPLASARALFHMHKDECAGKGKKGIKHIGIFTVDFAGVDPAKFDAGFDLRIGAKEYKWNGSRASSLKQRGDGMFKEPLMLMSSVSSYGKEYFNFVRWAGSTVAGVMRIPVAKYAGYKGLTLSVGRLGGKLKGGVATVELSDGGWIYSGGCFKMQAVRQATNGYPAP